MCKSIFCFCSNRAQDELIHSISSDSSSDELCPLPLESFSMHAKSGLMALSKDDLTIIFSFLDMTDLCITSKVNQHFHDISSSDQIWRQIIRRCSPSFSTKKKWKATFLRSLELPKVPSSPLTGEDGVIFLCVVLRMTYMLTNVILLIQFAKYGRWIWFYPAIGFLFPSTCALCYLDYKYSNHPLYAARPHISIRPHIVRNVVANILQIRILLAAWRYFNARNQRWKLTGDWKTSNIEAQIVSNKRMINREFRPNVEQTMWIGVLDSGPYAVLYTYLLVNNEWTNPTVCLGIILSLSSVAFVVAIYSHGSYTKKITLFMLTFFVMASRLVAMHIFIRSFRWLVLCFLIPLALSNLISSVHDCDCGTLFFLIFGLFILYFNADQRKDFLVAIFSICCVIAMTVIPLAIGDEHSWENGFWEKCIFQIVSIIGQSLLITYAGFRSWSLT